MRLELTIRAYNRRPVPYGQGKACLHAERLV